LEELTGAYVYIYAARSVNISITFKSLLIRGIYRPETVEENNRIFISKSFEKADPTLARRFSSVTSEINTTAIEISRSGGQGSKKPHTVSNGELYIPRQSGSFDSPSNRQPSSAG
jgi:hypothetical protein